MMLTSDPAGDPATKVQDLRQKTLHQSYTAKCSMDDLNNKL